MKKFIALLLVVMMLFTVASCGTANDTNTDTNTDGQVNDETNNDTNNDAGTTDGTLGQTLAKDFKDRVGADSTLSAQAIADEIIKKIDEVSKAKEKDIIAI